jgi:hypothetical protein
MRRIVTILSALAAGAMAAIMSASAAYAEVVRPVGGGATDPTTQVVHHHAALFGWQLALIVGAAAVLLAMTGALTSRRVRNGSHRPAIS